MTIKTIKIQSNKKPCRQGFYVYLPRQDRAKCRKVVEIEKSQILPGIKNPNTIPDKG